MIEVFLKLLSEPLYSVPMVICFAAAIWLGLTYIEDQQELHDGKITLLDVLTFIVLFTVALVPVANVFCSVLCVILTGRTITIYNFNKKR